MENRQFTFSGNCAAEVGYNAVARSTDLGLVRYATRAFEIHPGYAVA
jgi:hypothetical protein